MQGRAPLLLSSPFLAIFPPAVAKVYIVSFRTQDDRLALIKRIFQYSDGINGGLTHEADDSYDEFGRLKRPVSFFQQRTAAIQRSPHGNPLAVVYRSVDSTVRVRNGLDLASGENDWKPSDGYHRDPLGYCRNACDGFHLCCSI